MILEFIFNFNEVQVIEEKMFLKITNNNSMQYKKALM
jgi:hypothetical protein